MSVQIHSLHVYPVKSFRGIDLDSAELTATGLRHDRAWLVIDEQRRFLSQRRLPAMARVATSLHRDALELGCDGLPACRVPFQRGPGPTLRTEVWGDPCDVIDEGDGAAAWLKQALETTFTPRLVRMAPAYDRPQKRPERYGSGTHTFFADTAPFLVAAVSSLERLNQSLRDGGQDVVPMDRFRANVVISGLEAFAEHGLQALEGPGYRLGLRYPRERCVMTTMDQATGERDPAGEPFNTLRRINPMPDNPKGPAFGELAVLEQGAGVTIRAGDSLEIHSRTEE